MTEWDVPGAWDVSAFPGVGEFTGDAGDGLLLDLDGMTFGVPGEGSSVTVSDDTGMTICSDTDGDGRVDSMSVVTFDGGWSSWRLQARMTDGETAEGAEGADGGAGNTAGGMVADVSSVTHVPETAGTVDGGPSPDSVSGRGQEQGKQETVLPDVPPATPGNGRETWDTRGWKCVDRGNWG